MKHIGLKRVDNGSGRTGIAASATLPAYIRHGMNRQKCELRDQIIHVSASVGRRHYTGCSTVKHARARGLFLPRWNFWTPLTWPQSRRCQSHRLDERHAQQFCQCVTDTWTTETLCLVLRQIFCVAFYLQTLSAWTGLCLAFRKRHTGIKATASRKSEVGDMFIYWKHGIKFCACAAAKPTKVKVKVVPACKELETQLHKLWIYNLCIWMFIS